MDWTVLKKYFYTILILLVCLLLCSVTLWAFIGSGLLKFNQPDRQEFKLQGIDVSHHQGVIRWGEVSKSDVAFAYIKATEADDFVDSRFDFNYQEATKYNLPTGAYHFYSLGYKGAIQAENFLSVIGDRHLQLPPVIDLEYVGNSKMRPEKENFQSELSIFIKSVTSNLNRRPILYTTYEFYDDYLYPDFSEYDIWIRDVYSFPDKKIGNWQLWQYSSNGRIKGIEGNVDLNVVKRDFLGFIQ